MNFRIRFNSIHQYVHKNVDAEIFASLISNTVYACVSLHARTNFLIYLEANQFSITIQDFVLRKPRQIPIFKEAKPKTQNFTEE